jgi:protein involved in polysaccharide export with SLBB domain
MCRSLKESSEKNIRILLMRHVTRGTLLLLGLLIVPFTLSCTSNTAVEGIPVKDLVLSKERKLARRVIMTPEKEEAVREMSRVTENKVFKEISGFPEYRIGPLDVLVINSHVGENVTSKTVTVNSRGRISYSFIDDLYVNGLTPTELDSLLTKKMSGYIKRPRIDVLVTEFNSKSAMVLGQLTSLQASSYGKAASGRYHLHGKTTLVDLIAMAVGYTVQADIKSVKLIRDGHTYLLNLYDIITKGDDSQNVIINEGDFVDVPELPALGERVYVMGEVEDQGIYPLKQAQDLLGAIALAGSYTDLAKEENVLIVRTKGHEEKPLVMMADLRAILRKADIAQNIPLEDGDLVFVPNMKIADVNRWIQNITPLLDLLLYPGQFENLYFSNDKRVLLVD